MQNQPALQEIAVKSMVAFKCWTAHKIDHDATEQTLNNYQAFEGAGRFNKVLIDKVHLSNLRKIIQDARKYWHSVTLPWGNEGSRILPGVKIFEFESKMREFQRAFETEYEKLEANYTSIIDEQKRILGNMYNHDDYPSIEELRQKFGFENGKLGIKVEISGIESTDDIRLNMTEPLINRLKNQAAEEERDKIIEATRDIYRRLVQRLSAMVERLKATKTDKKTNDEVYAKFKNATITNLVEILELVPLLNIAGDETLDEVSRQLSEKLADIAPVDIRNDEQIRKEVIATGKKAMEQLERKMDFLFVSSGNTKNQQAA
jgi:hypothetical protein